MKRSKIVDDLKKKKKKNLIETFIRKNQSVFAIHWPRFVAVRSLLRENGVN